MSRAGDTPPPERTALSVDQRLVLAGHRNDATHSAWTVHCLLVQAFAEARLAAHYFGKAAALDPAYASAFAQLQSETVRINDLRKTFKEERRGIPECSTVSEQDD